MRVSEVSQMDKNVVNGKTNTRYTSKTTLSTDVDMNLTEAKSYYNDEKKTFYVLVYIDKAAASAFYENELKILISKVDNDLTIADNYIGSGFKQKAKTELQKTQRLFEDADNPFFWLNVFGLDEYKIQGYLSQVHEREQMVKQRLSDLEYGTTYCIIGNADLFGKKYIKLVNEVKGALSASGCNFVSDQTNADIVIRIQASARKYNEFQGAFFAYVDAAVSIDKNATGQRILEDEISVKGAHTISYDEAARSGYKEITKKITQLLKENIQL